MLFVKPREFLDSKQERARYATHQNEISDPNYRDYLKPALDE